MLEGKLVNLRAPEMSDLERNTRWMNDREVTRFLARHYPLSSAAEEAWLADLVKAPMSFTRTFFAIETKDGRHIGNTNLFDVVPEDRRARLGIMIGEKECWSLGYGRDALITLLRFAFDEMNLHRVELRVFAFNERAIACYRNCGFVEEVRQRRDVYVEGAFHDTLLMGVLSDEFRALHGGGGA